MPVQRDGLGDGRDDALRGVDGVLPAVHLLEQDDELVATEPADRVAGAGDSLHPLPDEAQQRVPRLVAQAVVDDFEMV